MLICKIVGDARLLQIIISRSLELLLKLSLTEPPDPKAGEVLRKFNLKEDAYILYVSRLEPENNALGVIQAYNKLNTEVPLVIVGDAPYADDYKSKLVAEAGARGYFYGLSDGEAYRATYELYDLHSS
ncbi:MAG: glycosyltransferase [Bdellovibrionota bacterium]